MKDTTNQETENKPQFARFKEAVRKTTYSRSSIYRGIKDGSFPIPVRIGKKAIAFRVSELDKWIESRPRVQPTTKNEEI